MNSFFLTFASLFINALSIAIFGRVIMSFVSPHGKDPLSVLLIQITEPILGPIRKVVPPLGMFDLTPMIALLALNMIVRPLLRQIFL